MAIFVSIILSLLVLYSLLCLALYLHYRVPYDGGERLLLTLPSGHSCSLYHRPNPKQRHARPVILCHGLGANRYNLDFPGHSLAEYLREEGFDVFVAELRGAGPAPKPRCFGRPGWRFDFDDLVAEDVPAMIARVKSETKAPDVLWCGHSMGGMLMYAYLSQGGEGVAAAFAIASPAALGTLPDGKRLAQATRLFRFLPYFPQPLVVASCLPLGTGRLLPFFLKNLIVPGTVPAKRSRQLMSTMFARLPLGLAYQFGMWLETNQFLSRDKRRDYLGGLAEVRVPFAFLSGAGDCLAPPASIVPAHERIASRDKPYFALSRQNAHHDYGHGDIVFADSAKEDVFAKVAAFFAPYGEFECAPRE